mmetsp:Transcript_18100/g.70007  ORF Transcript_18100/g.70007 Transcript_18100/m.70007 type:complete len:217 (-) Transcript_18100:385-1035(-)
MKTSQNWSSCSTSVNNAVLSVAKVNETIKTPLYQWNLSTTAPAMPEPTRPANTTIAPRTPLCVSLYCSGATIWLMSVARVLNEPKPKPKDRKRSQKLTSLASFAREVSIFSSRTSFAAEILGGVGGFSLIKSTASRATTTAIPASTSRSGSRSSSCTRMGGRTKPMATPTGFATLQMVVAMVRCSFGNQLAASIGGALSTNGCAIAAIVWPVRQPQ